MENQTVLIKGSLQYPHNMYYDPTTPNTEYNEYRNSFREYHEQTYGPLDAFGYKDFIPMFTLDNFDADYYADLVKKIGSNLFRSSCCASRWFCHVGF